MGAALTVAISEVVHGAIQGVTDAGADIGSAAKGAVIDVLRGTKAVGGEALDAVHVTAAVVKSTAEVGGGLGSAAKGAIASAKALGLSAEEAASAAATGALKAAGEIGSAAAGQVRNAVTGTIAGVKVVLKEPFQSQTGK